MNTFCSLDVTKLVSSNNYSDREIRAYFYRLNELHECSVEFSKLVSSNNYFNHELKNSTFSQEHSEGFKKLPTKNFKKTIPLLKT